MGVGAGLYLLRVVVKSSRSLSHLLMSSCYVEGVGWWRSFKLAVFDFLSEWRPPPLWIYKISKFWRSAWSSCQYVSPYQVWQCSIKPFVEYGDLAIFQNGGRRRLVFLNFRNFNDQKGQEGQTALVYKISCFSVKRMPIFRFFKTVAAAILDFQLSKL